MIELSPVGLLVVCLMLAIGLGGVYAMVLVFLAATVGWDDEDER